jgi:hypothetical protein
MHSRSVSKKKSWHTMAANAWTLREAYSGLTSQLNLSNDLTFEIQGDNQLGEKRVVSMLAT